MPFEDLCRAMYIAKGSSENLLPVNVGLLFFSKTPENFFPRAWIELVWHKDGSGKRFAELYFKGALHVQLRDALSFLKTNIIAEQVVKYPNKAEADRFYNFPYDAVEEALSNAVYHKSYELGSPIEVQVWPDKIEILSYPSPMPPVNAEALSTKRRIVAREYRNRRIGDFLKELHLTEGRGTGFPTIYDAMSDNGSPKPIFETDEQSYVLVTIPVHTGIEASVQVSDQESDQAKVNVFNSLEDVIAFCDQANEQMSNHQSNHQSNQVIELLKNAFGEKITEVLEILLIPQSSGNILDKIGVSKQTKNKKKYIDPLLEIGWIEYTIPNNVKDRNQRYRLTKSGKLLYQLINS
jgi:ATP-dependent DNA helicase RecG